MVRIFAFIAVLLIFPAQAYAVGEIVSEPICFMVINETSHSVNGSFGTDTYTREDGVESRHRSNFRLKEKGAVHEEEGYPLDKAEFCSYGPFYEGRQLEFVIRTLFPVFSCKTNVESGPIIIRSTPRVDDPMGGVDYSATCYE